MLKFIPIVIFILVFLPLPIKISLVSYDNRVYLYVFRIKFDIQKKIRKLIIYHKAKIEFQQKENLKVKVKVRNKVTDKKQRFRFSLESVKGFIRKLCNISFKPLLRLKINLNYGFNDAALTGITFGLINCISPILYRFTDIFFKVKNYEYNVKPDFNSQNFKYKIEIKSIIFVSFANVIYMAFIAWNNFVRLPKSIT